MKLQLREKQWRRHFCLFLSPWSQESQLQRMSAWWRSLSLTWAPEMPRPTGARSAGAGPMWAPTPWWWTGPSAGTTAPTSPTPRSSDTPSTSLTYLMYFFLVIVTVIVVIASKYLFVICWYFFLSCIVASNRSNRDARLHDLTPDSSLHSLNHISFRVWRMRMVMTTPDRCLGGNINIKYHQHWSVDSWSVTNNMMKKQIYSLIIFIIAVCEASSKSAIGSFEVSMIIIVQWINNKRKV